MSVVTLRIAGVECDIAYSYGKWCPQSFYEQEQPEYAEVEEIRINGVEVAGVLYDIAGDAGVTDAIEREIESRILRYIHERDEYHREMRDEARA